MSDSQHLMAAQTVKVPFMQHGNKRILTEKQIAEEPWLRDFIERFHNYFEHDTVNEFWIYKV